MGYEERDLRIARIVSQNLTAGQGNVDAGTQIQVSERHEKVEDFGFYVQEDLLLLEYRLALTGAVRAEQSSANGDTEKLFTYPKASAAYTLATPMARVDELKLRVAYGESGNQPLFGQKFISLDATNNIGGNPGLIVNPKAGDPDIQPERTREIEGGIDATLFDGNAVLELTAYPQNIEELSEMLKLAAAEGWCVVPAGAGTPLSDFHPALTSARAGCEAVFMMAVPLEASGVVSTAIGAGFAPRWIGQSPVWINAFPALVGDPAYLAENMWVVAEGTEWGDMSVAGMATMIEALETHKPDQDPDYYFAFGYNQARAVTEVLEKAVVHARKAHGVDLTASVTLVKFAQSAVRDEPAKGAK